MPVQEFQSRAGERSLQMKERRLKLWHTPSPRRWEEEEEPQKTLDEKTQAELEEPEVKVTDTKVGSFQRKRSRNNE